MVVSPTLPVVWGFPGYIEECSNRKLCVGPRNRRGGVEGSNVMESAMYSIRTLEYGGGANHDLFAFEDFWSVVYLMAVDAYSTVIPAISVTRVQYHERILGKGKNNASWHEHRVMV